MPKILVAARHVAVTDVLAVALRPEYAVRALLVRADASPESVACAALARRPAVMLVTVDLGSAFDSEALIRTLGQAGIPVVALGSADPDRDEAALERAVLAGAAGAVAKNDSVEVLRCAVRRAISGRPPVVRAPRPVTTPGTSLDERLSARRRLYALSASEREVLAELALGHTPTEIAHHRVVAVGTVRAQTRSIMTKLQVSSRLAAVALAIRADGDLAPAPTPAVSGSRSSASS